MSNEKSAVGERAEGEWTMQHSHKDDIAINELGYWLWNGKRQYHPDSEDDMDEIVIKLNAQASRLQPKTERKSDDIKEKLLISQFKATLIEKGYHEDAMVLRSIEKRLWSDTDNH